MNVEKIETSEIKTTTKSFEIESNGRKASEFAGLQPDRKGVDDRSAERIG